MPNANPYLAQRINSQHLVGIMRTLKDVARVTIEVLGITATGTFGISFFSRWGNVQQIVGPLEDGRMWHPESIQIYNSELFVFENTSVEDDRIEVFSLSGVFKRNWGSGGLGDDEFRSIEKILVYNDEVYTTEASGVNRVKVSDLDGVFDRKWGIGGSGDGEFSFPGDIVQLGGEIYVLDRGNFRVQVFNTAGTFQRKWGSQGTGDGQFENFIGGKMTVLGSEIYIAEGGSLPNAARVQVFNSAGTFQREWGSHGTGNGKWHTTRGILAHDNNIHLHDLNAGQVQVFNSSGVHQGNWNTSSLVVPAGEGEWDQFENFISNGTHIWILDTATGGSPAREWISKYGDSSLGVSKPFNKHGCDGSSSKIEDEAGIDAGINDNALTLPIPKGGLLTGETFTPYSVKLVQDVRDAIDNIAANGGLTNIVTGNALVRDFSGAEDIYKNAVNPHLAAIGATGGNTHTWQRTVNQLERKALADVEITELRLCADFLRRCAVGDGLLAV